MRVHVIAVPFDSGLHETRMGRGPRAILDGGLRERLEDVGGEVHLTVVEPPSSQFPSEIAMAAALQREVAALVTAARRAGALPLVLSGNCNTSVGTVSGLLAAQAAMPVVCWFDAHGDFNTPETSTSGFLDGMALSMLAGDCWRPLASSLPGYRPVPTSRVVLIGARDVDAAEARRLDASKILRVAVTDVGAGLERALGKVPEADEVYLHVDLDVLDPSEGRVNAYDAGAGLTRAALHDAIHRISRRRRIAAMALTAYDPDGDPERRIARLAVELASSVVAREREKRSGSGIT